MIPAGWLIVRRGAWNAWDGFGGHVGSAKIWLTLPVLIEKPGRQPGQVSGRSPYLQPVHIPADPALIGQVLPVEIVGQAKNSLEGRIVTAQAQAV